MRFAHEMIGQLYGNAEKFGGSLGLVLWQLGSSEKQVRFIDHVAKRAKVSAVSFRRRSRGSIASGRCLPIVRFTQF
jgi:hypothetical protein